MLNTLGQTIEEQVKAFCARIGKDPLLVQGAGGNVSWKDGDTLWVKASGTWLSDSEEKNIFVPVNLDDLRQAIANKNFHAIPKVVGDSSLRPSIETLLHALMPHKVVVHLHAIEILAHLVRANPEEVFTRLIGGAIKWCCVDYFKPGAELAEAVTVVLLRKTDADVVFLRNHGVVIGGGSVECIERTLCQLLSLMQTATLPSSTRSENATPNSVFQVYGYVPCSDKDLNQLATKDEFISRLQTEWVLYPDHVVFLGGEAAIIGPYFNSTNLAHATVNKPPYIFAIGKGVYESRTLTTAQKLQLRCYYDVLSRQGAAERLSSLNKEQIAGILSWEAEKYRSSVSR
jgi:rhamnose utilization protein RhaD (predicted bifunctional aldolase and dehydrogenase)